MNFLGKYSRNSSLASKLKRAGQTGEGGLNSMFKINISQIVQLSVFTRSGVSPGYE